MNHDVPPVKPLENTTFQNLRNLLKHFIIDKKMNETFSDESVAERKQLTLFRVTAGVQRNVVYECLVCLYTNIPAIFC